MKAYFDRTSHPRVELIVGGRKNKRLLVALLDTGFDGYVSLPVNIAVQLGLELATIERVQYADGRISNELVFAVDVDIDGEIRSVRGTLTNGIEALVGTALFADHKVLFDFPEKQISIS